MITVDLLYCVGCAMCVAGCDEEAIQCYGLAVIDHDCCTACRECLEYCPTNALSYREPIKENHAQETC